MKEAQPRYRILVLADAWLTVPPKGYGGTERVLALLCDQLQRRGHEVTLIARKGSRNFGRLRTYPSLGDRRSRWRWIWCRLRFQFQVLAELRARPHAVISAVASPDFLRPLQSTGIPLLHTFHSAINDDHVRALRQRTIGPLGFVALTASHLNGRHGPEWRVINNPVNLEDLKFNPSGSDGYLAYLGILSHSKGVDTAISVAERAGLPLKMAGIVHSADREFFETCVRPRLKGRIEWIGEIGDVEKSEFLGNARALLMPIRGSEAFGLVVVEAFACGTPVIAMNRASMPELIRNGITGYLVDDEDEMADRVAKSGAIRRQQCRIEAEERFSPATLTDEYLAALEELLASCAEPDSPVRNRGPYHHFFQILHDNINRPWNRIRSRRDRGARISPTPKDQKTGA